MAGCIPAGGALTGLMSSLISYRSKGTLVGYFQEAMRMAS